MNDLVTQLEALDAHLTAQNSSVLEVINEAAVRMLGHTPFEPAALSVPVNVDVPYVDRTDDTLACTMGNWKGEPASYRYQWARDGADVGQDSDTYDLSENDIGRKFHCTVTATNAAGATTAPPSNEITA